MESKFKVGDRVVRPDGYLFDEDYVFTVEKVIEAVDKIKLKGINGTYYAGYFKLYKEDPMKQFDMRTQPWFIRVNNEQEFHLIQEWLKDSLEIMCPYNYNQEYNALTNADSNGNLYNTLVLNTANPSNTFRHEIKLNFKTTIDSVEWPIVESEKDKKIRELKETIEAAAKQIKELEEM